MLKLHENLPATFVILLTDKQLHRSTSRQASVKTVPRQNDGGEYRPAYYISKLNHEIAYIMRNNTVRQLAYYI